MLPYFLTDKQIKKLCWLIEIQMSDYLGYLPKVIVKMENETYRLYLVDLFNKDVNKQVEDLFNQCLIRNIQDIAMAYNG